MSVKYNITERKNLQDPQAAPKFYASAKADGKINLKSLSREIAGDSTTVSDTDVLAVLNDLIKAVNRHLADGKIVKLGDFGNFQVSISSDGAETEEKVTSALIRGNKINFRPGVDLRDMLSTVKYEKYSR
ncbi:HU family DNA-binding protein [Chryseobacterium sp. 2TAF14]|uniref:HU family DNA-binding protein n=1 Tax=Chryseobacterium sp. 2TAF14 TaxID=3233007 RepID=UPI003F919D3E